MKQACRIFNFLMPFTSYRELRSMSERTEKPVEEIVRQGINLILKKHRHNCHEGRITNE